MDKPTKAHELTMLYLQQKDFTDLDASNFVDLYRRYYVQIIERLVQVEPNSPVSPR